MKTSRHGARRLTGLALASISMTVALAACSGSGGGDAAEPRHDSAGVDADVPVSEREAGRSPAEADGSLRDTASTSGRASGGSAPEPRARAVISKGTVSLTADDVGTARQDVQRVVDARDGAISEEQTETDEDGELSYTRLVVRVPAESFGATMTALEGVATFRTSDRGSEDVTTEVIDNDVRVRAQQASLTRVEALLARADSLKEIIWIESQLTHRQAELDSLRSQQAWLSDQTSLATITVDIARAPEEGKAAEKEDDGFLAGLAGGWKALSATATTLATVVGALLPFLAVGLLVGVPAWLVVRRSRARRRTVAVGEP